MVLIRSNLPFRGIVRLNLLPPLRFSVAPYTSPVFTLADAHCSANMDGRLRSLSYRVLSLSTTRCEGGEGRTRVILAVRVVSRLPEYLGHRLAQSLINGISALASQSNTSSRRIACSAAAHPLLNDLHREVRRVDDGDGPRPGRSPTTSVSSW